MRKEYTVTWTIELEAYSKQEAAYTAHLIQRDSTSTANVFMVDDEEVDLDSKEYLEYELDLVNRTVMELEYGDERLMTNANGNKGRYENLLKRRYELYSRLKNL